MEPFYDDGNGIVIYHGDVLDTLDHLDVGSVEGVIADPPYCSGARQQAGARVLNNGKMNRGSDRTDGPEWFLVDNMGTDTYVWWLRQIGQRLIRVCRSGSHFYCFTDWRQYTNVVTAFESVGWTLRTCIVWDKGDTGMGSFWRSSHEFVTVFSKGQARELPHHGFFNVIRATKPAREDHPTVKPLSLIKRLVEASGAAMVLDPFMGSGTTLRAAKDLGRRAIGIEIEEKYCEIAAKRLQQQVLPLAV
jgi:site-specific DNA-methyltransferase (adenine-specific)